MSVLLQFCKDKELDPFSLGVVILSADYIEKNCLFGNIYPYQEN